MIIQAIERRPLTTIFVLAAMCMSASLEAQTPGVAPRADFLFHDRRTVGIFEIQRWIDAAEPEVSPSGMCNCITVVYLGDRQVLIIDPGASMATGIDPHSGEDINGDKSPELIVSQYTGGAHCCSSTTVYSVSAQLRTILEIHSGHCSGEFGDLDKDGTLEFVVCDDSWAYTNCAFAVSPMPRIGLLQPGSLYGRVYRILWPLSYEVRGRVCPLCRVGGPVCKPFFGEFKIFGGRSVLKTIKIPTVAIRPSNNDQIDAFARSERQRDRSTPALAKLRGPLRNSRWNFGWEGYAFW